MTMQSSIKLHVAWVRGREDRLFGLLVLLVIPLFIALVLWLNSQQPAELERRELTEVAPQLARLILDKPAPPEPRELEKIAPPPDEPEPVEAAEPEPREITPAPPPPKPADSVPEPEVSPARRKAARSGLLAFSDDLAALRDEVDLASLDEVEPTAIESLSDVTTSTRDELARRSQAGSGGIADASLARGDSRQQLARRQAAAVASNIEAEVAARQPVAGRGTGATSAALTQRSRDEVEKVFQQNKGPIHGIYNRALRQNPGLQGRVVVELTIAPDGRITDCRLVSSELGDAELERRLISRIKRFRFEPRDVELTTVSYPIDFLPS